MPFHYSTHFLQKKQKRTKLLVSISEGSPLQLGGYFQNQIGGIIWDHVVEIQVSRYPLALFRTFSVFEISKSPSH